MKMLWYKYIDFSCFMELLWNEEKDKEEDGRSVHKAEQVDKVWKKKTQPNKYF